VRKIEREKERERERSVFEGKKRSRVPIDRRLPLNSIYTSARAHIVLVIARSRSSGTNFMKMSPRGVLRAAADSLSSRNISLQKFSRANSAGMIHFCQSAIGMRKKKRARQKRATRSISLSARLSSLPLPPFVGGFQRA